MEKTDQLKIIVVSEAERNATSSQNWCARTWAY